MPWTNPRRYRSDAFLREAGKILAAGLIALSTSACSFSLGMMGMGDDEPKSTGAIAPTDAAPQAVAPLSADLDEEDWRRAKAALAVALDPQGPGTQVSWDNPETSMKGSFTPAGAPFVKNDEICRAFNAQLSGPASASLQGTACRLSGEEWAIKEVKPAGAGAKPDKSPAKTAKKIAKA
ncbi:RT0821/Lpp0805 family surface protein [Microvirga guangxiensis]|uniref:Surface antigen n=1 Tax=Microvirga guangxiensis TaxID=549386 RepID=A0A1G5JS46_9HYPH|nr:RT0821/Lpp0805 family surface protein [Microvirga guangxiensis]SCY90489.1 Surface antigen [Microvirga guangxiensis]